MPTFSKTGTGTSNENHFAIESLETGRDPTAPLYLCPQSNSCQRGSNNSSTTQQAEHTSIRVHSDCTMIEQIVDYCSKLNIRKKNKKNQK